MFQCRTCSGLVTVVHHDEPPRDALQQFALRLGEGRAASGHNVLDTALRHRHHVHLAFTDVGKARFCYGLPCLVETIYQVAFSEQHRLSRVQVFHHGVLADGPSREADDFATPVVVGERQPSLERVMHLAPLLSPDDICHQQEPLLKAPLPQRPFHEVVPRCISQAKAFHAIVVHVALGQILASLWRA